MKSYPPIPHVEDATEDLLDSGHLWLQELVDGGQLRFQLRDTGVLRFADSRRPFGDDVPPQYRHAVRHVRETLDRGALRSAVQDVETVTFVGVSTHRRAVPYEFARLPSLLGVDVWDEDRDEFLPPDATERVFDRLGLATVNTFRREVRAVDFEPDPGDIPDSAWYDGPAAGIVVRNKTGNVAQLPNPAVARDAEPEPVAGDADAAADRLATDALIGRVVDGHPADRAPTHDAVFERVHEAVLREHHSRLTHRDTGIDRGAFTAALDRRVRVYLATEG